MKCVFKSSSCFNRSAPCAGEWVAEEPMEPSPPPSPLLTKQRVVPTSPIMLNNTMNTSSKQTSNMSSKLGNKQTGKQAPGSLVSATESRTSSKVFINFVRETLDFDHCCGKGFNWS